MTAKKAEFLTPSVIRQVITEESLENKKLMDGKQ